MIKIGIVGHLNLKETCIHYYENRVQDILKSLKKTDKDILIYSALADGADSLVVEAGIELNINYVAVLPMEKSLYMMDFDQESKTKFNDLLDNAISVVEMPLVKNNTPSSISINPDKRSLQYEAAGMYISDTCDILMTLWDGKYTKLKGGTSEIVKYHRAKPIFKLYHLLVSRSNDLTNDMVEFKLYDNKEKL